MENMVHTSYDGNNAVHALCMLGNSGYSHTFLILTTDHMGRVIIRIRPYTENCWVAYMAPTTPWRWKPLAETCRGRIWNVLIKIYYFLEHLLVISRQIYIVQYSNVRECYFTRKWLSRCQISLRLSDNAFLRKFVSNFPSCYFSLILSRYAGHLQPLRNFNNEWFFTSVLLMIATIILIKSLD
jgi:hypothetical protein